jgi:nucleotide-binding universal stress UspA family protein
MNDFFRCERILVPTDLSAFAGRAVQYAHGLAEQCHAELHVLHVTPDPDRLAQGVGGVVDPAGAADDPGRWLGELIGEKGNIRRVEAVRLGSDVAQTVVGYAKKNAIDLIVMASHGRTGLRHLLFGSVAEQLLRTAPCPVLVIRPES